MVVDYNKPVSIPDSVDNFLRWDKKDTQIRDLGGTLNCTDSDHDNNNLPIITRVSSFLSDYFNIPVKIFRIRGKEGSPAEGINIVIRDYGKDAKSDDLVPYDPVEKIGDALKVGNKLGLTDLKKSRYDLCWLATFKDGTLCQGVIPSVAITRGALKIIQNK